MPSPIYVIIVIHRVHLHPLKTPPDNVIYFAFNSHVNFKELKKRVSIIYLNICHFYHSSFIPDISDVKFTVTLIVLSLCVILSFSLTVFKMFSLPLVFSSSIMMRLGIDSFEFFLFGG